MNASRPPQRRGLGRGLGSLIPTGPPATEPDASAATRRPRDGRRSRRPGWRRSPAPTSPSSRSGRSRPTAVQPRQVFDEEAMAELVHSIREVGLLQPVVVRRHRRRGLRAGHGRAPLARRPGGRPRRRSRRSSARPTTSTCCATRCWRTCTAPSSTRWRRPRPTPSCSTTSAAPTRSWPAGSAARGPRSATRCGCSSSARPSSAGSPPACSRPATPGRCSPSRTPTCRTGWPQRVVAEGISVRGLEEIVAVGDPGGPPPRPVRAQADRPRPGRPGRAALRPVRDPGQGRPRPAQGQDHRRVRLARRPAPDRRHHGPAQPDDRPI